ncbi:hypothetical protein PAXINDRAFT_114412 [Paxillus involutus ATCC 200175]|uniref:Large ribosomal subunit protein mL59 domain-containing protein n=1 Tax=Paxillus involutus ATCC 200175 TaxID=664439 RepID=A0A0C9UAC6_PAXIN|nr:hypothetical protein PAXINDRAFT_114412 [Paxillus involutus ATCC 200175]
MASRAIKRFRIRELTSSPPPPPALKPILSTTGGAFDFSKFDFSQPTPTAPAVSTAPTSNLPKRANPFIATLNPKTGRWAPPKYSLRQQAELVKKARSTGTLSLLPPAPKTSAAQFAAIALSKSKPIVKKPRAQMGTESKTLEKWWSRPVEWVGEVKERKVPGAEIGNRLYAGKKRMFKGHKWERVAAKRAMRRRILMRDMPKRIERFKRHYKRRRPSPLKPAKGLGGKLPF